ncbi:MAG: hypothetical protein ACK504_10415 [Bacteroidota bacterium]
MIKDIVFPEVVDIAIAIVQEFDGLDEYNAYVFNFKEESIKNVLITSTGYGFINDVKKKTSTLRHYFEEIQSLDYKFIEPVSKEVFGISNEYWISFTINENMYDKQYVFLPESVVESNFQTIPFLNKKGVIIK